ncbi:carbon-nitrogen hydrolase family protein [Marinobacter sp. SS21]|uniref:carbon-nitrogen hydrolase family protein n=1 Tax=Marinobacter sp. SS21 TaxID=2979460 RepID=UPI00232C03B3|nr:carbon-nitrogen hydrolase family protein [Marinobacter sp. SS21]MDC0661739.1 carbon-nitrogen hydrolase family protein [Marinobacter sp. SS21]
MGTALSGTGTSVAGIQMVSGGDVQENLREARELLEAAAQAKAKIAVLPENFAVLKAAQMVAQGRRECDGDGEIRAFLSAQARRLGMWLVGGSMPLAQRPDGSAMERRVRASCLVYDDRGQQVARYDKVHLFDADVDDAHGRYRESDTFEPGQEVVTVDTPAGVLGLAVCYDLRFPELFRKLREQGADWVALPSAFTYMTGEAHWHALIRARAIENQFWMVAAGQGGRNSPRRHTFGHSMVVDPWGVVVAERQNEGPGWVSAELDPERLAKVRQRMPVWGHRRL